MESPVDTLRGSLAAKFPEIHRVHTDAYIAAVIAVPGRTYEYARDEKISNALQWRRDFGVDALCGCLRHSDGQWALVGAAWAGLCPCTLAMCCSDSLRWTVGERGPVLHSVVSNVDWAQCTAIMQHHVRLIEYGISELLPSAHTESFEVMADVSHLSLLDLPPMQLVQGLVSLLQQAYPERIKAVHIGPTNAIIRGIFRIAKAFMSVRSSEKIVFHPGVPQ